MKAIFIYQCIYIDLRAGVIPQENWLFKQFKLLILHIFGSFRFKRNATKRKSSSVHYWSIFPQTKIITWSSIWEISAVDPLNTNLRWNRIKQLLPAWYRDLYFGCRYDTVQRIKLPDRCHCSSSGVETSLKISSNSAPRWFVIYFNQTVVAEMFVFWSFAAREHHQVRWVWPPRAPGGKSARGCEGCARPIGRYSDWLTPALRSDSALKT